MGNSKVYWAKEAKKIVLSTDEWNEFVANELDFAYRLNNIVGKKTDSATYSLGFWNYDQSKASIYRRNLVTNDFEIISWKEKDDTEGFEARRLFVEKMEKSGNGKFQKRFGATTCDTKIWNNNGLGLTNLDLVQAIHDINRCVGPFVGNEVERSVDINGGLWKADVKSAYPAAALNNLPDLHNAKLVKGEVEPNAEYPVVFYLRSHNIAEFGVFDTREEKYHHLYKNFRHLGRNQTKYKDEDPISFITVDAEDEISLCCKYAAIGLPEFQYFYDLKEEAKINPNIPIEEAAAAKKVMNYTIGTLDFVKMDDSKKKVAPSTVSYYGHIRALVLGRHNHRMIQFYDEIKAKGFEFVCIQTDSLMWIGDSAIPSSVEGGRALGDLNIEIKNGNGYIHRTGCYFVQDDETKIVKHQGMKTTQDFDTIDEFKEFVTNKTRVKKTTIDLETLIITTPEEME